MFGRRKDLNPAENAALKVLTQAWQGIAPSAGFESDVWRRIRTQAVATVAHPADTSWRRLPEWLLLPPPVRLPALALSVLLLLVGGLLGTVAGYAEAGRRTAATQPLLATHTLAGAYASLSTGGWQ